MSLTFLFPRSSIAYALNTHTHTQTKSGRKGVNQEPEQQIIWSGMSTPPLQQTTPPCDTPLF